MSFKQVILVRTDLKMGSGKTSAQVAHASVEAVLKSHKDDLTAWKNEGMKKVVLGVHDLRQLLEYKQKAEDHGLVVGLISDQGKTELIPGTVTCLGIGPHKEEKIDPVTKDLKSL